MSSEITVEEQQKMVGEFLEGLAKSFGLEASAENVSADSFEVNLVGDKMALGALIGHRGSQLVALHEVTKTMLQRRLPGANRARIRVDVAGFRQRRREVLQAYVQELAKSVLGDGVEKGLETMNAADRKVVHDTANEIEGISTISVCDEPRRRVVLTPSKA